MQQTPASPEAAVGVCYLTAAADPAAAISELVVRFVMTDNVHSARVQTQYARGFDQACLVLRFWMTAMCQQQPDL